MIIDIAASSWPSLFVVHPIILSLLGHALAGGHPSAAHGDSTTPGCGRRLCEVHDAALEAASRPLPSSDVPGKHRIKTLSSLLLSGALPGEAQEWQWAVGIISSRGFRHQGPTGAAVYTLVPVLDMANHRPRYPTLRLASALMPLTWRLPGEEPPSRGEAEAVAENRRRRPDRLCHRRAVERRPDPPYEPEPLTPTRQAPSSITTMGFSPARNPNSSFLLRPSLNQTLNL